MRETRTMATEQDDADIPESGGVFTFGKSRFADNLPNKFWIRNDEVRQVACGDEHTVLLAESSRVFVFGDNSYGQLGLGHTKAITKPTCIKLLKGESVSVIGCGKSHTLVGTSTGQLFCFGANNDHQCGLESDGNVETPTEVKLSQPIKFTQLAGGSCHSVGLDDRGRVYVWGDNGEGQLGLGEDDGEFTEPTELRLEEKVVRIACGYYHTALVTQSGQLYTFGEVDDGKLGHGDGVEAREPTRVESSERFVWVACGGHHTVAVTASGAVLVFGKGDDGQLGLGTSVFEASRPTRIESLKQIKIRQASCGENATAVVSDKGQMYTFGNGRHGKLALGAEDFSNQFRPFRVTRFSKFEVTQACCGGCHTIALAHKRDGDEANEEVLDSLDSSYGNSLRQSVDGGLGGTARDRRRAKEPVEPLSRTLPPLTATGRSLPPLNSTLPSSKLLPLEGSSNLPATLDKRKLPTAKFSSEDFSKDEEDSDVSVTPEGSSEEEEEEPHQTLTNKRRAMKLQSAKLTGDGRRPPQPAKREAAKTDSRKKKAASEDEDEESPDEGVKAKQLRDKNVKKAHAKSRQEESDEDEEDDEEESEEEEVLAKNVKNKRASLFGTKKSKAGKKTPPSDEEDEEDEEADSALDDSEEELKSKSKKGIKSKKDEKKSPAKQKSKKGKLPDSEDDDEEDEEKTPKKKKAGGKKSSLSIFGKKGRAKLDLDDDEDEDEDEESEEEPKPKGKNKSPKSKKKGKNDDDDDDEEDADANDSPAKGKGDGDKKEVDTKNAGEPEKKSRACVIL